jgi:arsenate reductase (thioredoxin)
MAEGLFNAMAPDGWRAGSAGTESAQRVKPAAIAVMQEIGVDISGHHPKHLRDALTPDLALVIGLCAEEACPVIPGARSEHWPLADPSGSADPNVYRKIRDDLRRRIADLVERLQKPELRG